MRRLHFSLIWKTLYRCLIKELSSFPFSDSVYGVSCNIVLQLHRNSHAVWNYIRVYLLFLLPFPVWIFPLEGGAVCQFFRDGGQRPPRRHCGYCSPSSPVQTEKKIWAYLKTKFCEYWKVSLITTNRSVLIT